MRISDWSSDVCSSDLSASYLAPTNVTEPTRNYPMALLPIITAPDKRLEAISTPVEAVTDDVRRQLDDMLETMYAAPGIGLAAIQVDIAKRMLVIDIARERSEEHTSELQSLMRISYGVFCLKKKK